jgi:hypothetical protein
VQSDWSGGGHEAACGEATNTSRFSHSATFSPDSCCAINHQEHTHLCHCQAGSRTLHALGFKTCTYVPAVPLRRFQSVAHCHTLWLDQNCSAAVIDHGHVRQTGNSHGMPMSDDCSTTVFGRSNQHDKVSSACRALNTGQGGGSPLLQQAALQLRVYTRSWCKPSPPWTGRDGDGRPIACPHHLRLMHPSILLAQCHSG